MSGPAAKYDRIGVDYARLRRPDPRIAEQLWAALGDARRVLNVGAGTGSYEPPDRDVTALDPSAEMIAQRPAGSGRAIRGSAENLPFDDNSFDAAMAVLTVHHWADKARGMAEMRRVSRGPVVILTCDPAMKGFWQHDYFPGLAELDDGQMPQMASYEAWLGPVDIATVPVPHDCQDGFLYAWWRRPEAYLDPRLRAGSSSFWALGDVSEGVARLARDLDSGAWAARHGDLLDRESCDMGYRLVVTRP